MTYSEVLDFKIRIQKNDSSFLCGDAHLIYWLNNFVNIHIDGGKFIILS